MIIAGVIVVLSKQTFNCSKCCIDFMMPAATHMCECDLFTGSFNSASHLAVGWSPPMRPSWSQVRKSLMDIAPAIYRSGVSSWPVNSTHQLYANHALLWLRVFPIRCLKLYSCRMRMPLVRSLGVEAAPPLRTFGWSVSGIRQSVIAQRVVFFAADLDLVFRERSRQEREILGYVLASVDQPRCF